MAWKIVKIQCFVDSCYKIPYHALWQWLCKQSVKCTRVRTGVQIPRAYIKIQAGLVAPWTPNTWEARTGSLSQASYLGWQKLTSPGFSKGTCSSKCVEWEQSREMPIVDFRLEHMCAHMHLHTYEHACSHVYTHVRTKENNKNFHPGTQKYDTYWCLRATLR